ncbi:MAG: ribbon-helix-helix protein, CopG family [Parcubacteria group bacterium]|nr:ribbon-helix-helix protein, CopG family [Parcubacteria group bacterium]
MSNNTTVVPISLPKAMAKELDRAAKKQFMTRSEFARDMLRRQLAFTRLDELRRAVSSRASAAGIRTLEDAVKAVRELRDGKK